MGGGKEERTKKKRGDLNRGDFREGKRGGNEFYPSCKKGGKRRKGLEKRPTSSLVQREKNRHYKQGEKKLLPRRGGRKKKRNKGLAPKTRSPSLLPEGREKSVVSGAYRGKKGRGAFSVFSGQKKEKSACRKVRGGKKSICSLILHLWPKGRKGGESSSPHRAGEKRENFDVSEKRGKGGPISSRSRERGRGDNVSFNHRRVHMERKQMKFKKGSLPGITTGKKKKEKSLSVISARREKKRGRGEKNSRGRKAPFRCRRTKEKRGKSASST